MGECFDVRGNATQHQVCLCLFSLIQPGNWRALSNRNKSSAEKMQNRMLRSAEEDSV